VSCRHI